MHVNPIPKLTDYEVCIAVSLVDTTTLETGWANIGGLDDLITDLRESVILPFRSAYFLPQSKLFRAPKGVLLYGPPGCGKTLLARATARAANARFFNLQVCVFVCIDAVLKTVYSFLTTRSVHDNESTRMMKTQFMALWDGLLSEPDSRIIVIGATNRPSDLDSAILRCMVRFYFTPEFLKSFAEQTEGLSGSDLFEICREAALRGFRAWLHASPSSPQSVESSSTSP
ncbi:unnamed protein product [Mesocestoides corti]|uniref:AAA+ ATPase domain-containing protein n=1 Tax=Mesocestoides corti TaxID=53468 RepID=A0A3P6GJU1_MESCO|nr:unnamed protein product [Mesocestoides corti]